MVSCGVVCCSVVWCGVVCIILFRLVGWLAGWLVGWLVGWLLLGWLVDWLVKTTQRHQYTQTQTNSEVCFLSFAFYAVVCVTFFSGVMSFRVVSCGSVVRCGVVSCVVVWCGMM